ncbi:uncharacterized protein LOC128332554 [Hemicordylus capensis]|uniref:uncharacterized protein LOC128332554 n=1 Tax=Hemicordylus capensis TaxID=884348 RepID=UPI00230386B5|nr:uncharacterized protein LOC128332554 [Hemicordylus capensis]
MKRGHNTAASPLATERAPAVPCQPVSFSHFNGYQSYNWRLEGHTSVLSQNRYKSKQPGWLGICKNRNLPFLKLPAGPVHLRGGRRWDNPSSNVRASSRLKGKYSYFHFTSPVRLTVKPSLRNSRCDLQRVRLAALKPFDPAMQDLRVSGMTYRPLPRTDPSLPQMRRPKLEIHVYIPNGKESIAAESSDEGFLEEMDNRFSTLRLKEDSNL